MFLMLRGVIRMDQDIVKVDDNIDIKQVGEDVLHEPLEGCQGIAESKGHDQHFKESKVGLEGRLPFVALGNAYQVVG